MTTNAKPRIAVLGTRGIPANFGGSETVVEQLGEVHARDGWSVTVYCRRHRSTTSDAMYKGMRRVVLPSINTLGLDTPTHSLLGTLHVILKNTADVVHFHGVGNAMFAPILRLFGKKVVITVDGFDWKRPKWGRVAKAVLRRSFDWAASWSNAVIADNRPVHEWMRDALGRQTHLIFYGTDLSRVEGHDALAEYGLTPRGYILYVGGLIPDKGPHVLIEAFEKLETDMRLVIVGDTPYFSEYAEKLRTTKDPRVLFTGFVYGNKYRQLLQNAYVYAHPFLAEGTSPALLQAMSAGNCVVVGDLSETLDVVADAALIFKVGDSDDLRRALAHALANPAEVEALRLKARRRVEQHFSWDKIAREHADVYAAVA